MPKELTYAPFSSCSSGLQSTAGRPRSSSSSSSNSTFALFAILLFFLSSLPQPSRAVSATGAVYECWKALSYDICVVRDLSGICPARFQQLQYSGQAALDIFNYYLDKYADATNFTAEFWIAQCFSPTDPSYATYLDSVYNTTCSTDTGVAALLTANTTDGSAIAAQQAYLWLLQQAFFCTENEDATPGMGCVCKEGKDCDPLNSSGHISAVHTLVVALVGLVLLIVWRCVVQTKQGYVVQDRQDRVVQVIELNSVAQKRAVVPSSSAPPSSPPPQVAKKAPATNTASSSSTATISQRRSAVQGRVYTEPGPQSVVGRSPSGSNLATAATLAASSERFGSQ